MIQNNAGLYAAFKAKDTRFDGRFFVGVSSTGIYCRPVCKAKQPKAENCTFYRTAAEAEQAGYRPCLLCRPELAPGASITDAATGLAYRAARILEENCGGGQSLNELAGQLGCTSRHLRRVFSAEYNVSPIQYMQTCRLLLAKNLLTETSLSVLEVAMAAGFGSLRRFNDLFKRHYHLSPTALRNRIKSNYIKGNNLGNNNLNHNNLGHSERSEAYQKSGSNKTMFNGAVTLALGYRPPYPWEEMLRFLAGRAIHGIELVKNGEYMRTVRILAPGEKYALGWIQVGHKPEKNALSVTLSESLLPVAPQALARVRHLFDLYCDPDAVYETLRVMNNIFPGLCVLGTRLPGCFNAFEMAVRAVLGQQITVKAASTLAARVVEAYGTPVQTEIPGLTHIFPTPEDILSLEGGIENRPCPIGIREAGQASAIGIENHLGPLGITAVRAKTILELARAIIQGGLDIDFPARPEEEMEKLMTIRGIGKWTAQYIAMRAMGWPDAFLETDVGVKKALPDYTSKELLAMAEEWRPWRSYATISLWNSGISGTAR